MATASGSTGSKQETAELGTTSDTLGEGGGGGTLGSSGGAPSPATQQADQVASGTPVNTKGNQPGLYGGGGVQAQQNVIAAGTSLTGAQQIEQLLQPYIKELTQLGPEYQKEMNFLAPYLAPAHQESFQDIVNTSKADESSTGDTAVAAADQAAGEAILNQQAPGFAGEASAAKQAAAVAPYQEPITAGEAYQKYLQTYGGLPASTTNWPTEAAAAYQEIMGGAGGGTGLPSITNAAAANQANTNLTTTANNVTQAYG